MLGIGINRFLLLDNIEVVKVAALNSFLCTHQFIMISHVATATDCKLSIHALYTNFSKFNHPPDSHAVKFLHRSIKSPFHHPSLT